MSYTAPTITASSGTFAQLQTGGLPVQLELLITANSGLSQFQINEIRGLLAHTIENTNHRAARVVHNFLAGRPVASATVTQQILDYATVFAVLSTALNEIGTLVDANAGTLGTTVSPAGIVTPVRTFP